MEAIKLIEEAVDSGARLPNTCKSLGITERTYYRWKNLDKSYSSYEDRRAYADHSDPSNKLSPEERQRVLDIVNEERFASMPPCQIVPALADEGEYIASESTIYRILREEKMQNHRGRSQEPGKYGKPTSFCATAPNQVWTWDITYLRAAVKGLFYYLYLIVDVFSRDIVGWEVWEEESADHASDLIRRTCIAQGRLTIEPLVLHSDYTDIIIISEKPQRILVLQYLSSKLLGVIFSFFIASFQRFACEYQDQTISFPCLLHALCRLSRVMPSAS